MIHLWLVRKRCFMKNFLIAICIFIYPSIINAQDPSMRGVELGLQNILNNSYSYSSTSQQGYLNGGAAVISAEGNYLYNQSMANINNQTAYSMHLENQQLRTQTYFRTRQINNYYRDLEAYQKQQRAYLIRSGRYDRRAIEELYLGVMK